MRVLQGLVHHACYARGRLKLMNETFLSLFLNRRPWDLKIELHYSEKNRNNESFNWNCNVLFLFCAISCYQWYVFQLHYSCAVNTHNWALQAIHQDHWSLHVHLRQRYLLHNLHLLQRDIPRRNRTTTRWPIPRTPSRRRKEWQGRIETTR